MFVKSAVFFFALVVFTNAAPITDYDTDQGIGPVEVSDPIKLDPSVEIQLLSDAHSKREASLNTGDDLDFDVDISKRTFAGGDLGLNGVSVTLPHLKRESDSLETLSEQISNAFDNLNQQISEVMNDIGWPSRKRRDHEARDIVIDSHTLVQLQNFINDSVNLLRAIGKSDAVNTFLSQVNNLKTEVRKGTLDLNDLLNAAQNIILSL